MVVVHGKTGSLKVLGRWMAWFEFLNGGDLVDLDRACDIVVGPNRMAWARWAQEDWVVYGSG